MVLMNHKEIKSRKRKEKKEGEKRKKREREELWLGENRKKVFQQSNLWNLNTISIKKKIVII